MNKVKIPKTPKMNYGDIIPEKDQYSIHKSFEFPDFTFLIAGEIPIEEPAKDGHYFTQTYFAYRVKNDKIDKYFYPSTSGVLSPIAFKVNGKVFEYNYETIKELNEPFDAMSMYDLDNETYRLYDRFTLIEKLRKKEKEEDSS